MIEAFELIPIIASTGPSMALPGPYWLFTLLHWLTFALHLTAMNILFAGLLVVILGRTGLINDDISGTLVKLLPTALAATISLGVAPLLFLQVIYGELFYSASILSAWSWFFVIPVLIVTYYLLYAAALKKNVSAGKKNFMLMTAAIGLVYVSILLTSVSDLAIKPNLWESIYASSPEGFGFNPDYVEIFFRWAHSLTGAFVIFGVTLQLFAVFHKKYQGNQQLFKFGRRIFIYGLVTTSVFGIIYILVLDSAILMKCLKSPGLYALLGSIVFNLIALYLAYRKQASGSAKKSVVLTALFVFLGLICMVITRHFLRLIFLGDYFDPKTLETATQMGPLLMFLITFIAGLVVLFWMIGKYFETEKTS